MKVPRSQREMEQRARVLQQKLSDRDLRAKLSDDDKKQEQVRLDAEIAFYLEEKGLLPRETSQTMRFSHHTTTQKEDLQ